jgi:GH15 family glucan-1,4-alpha-glucosidase
LKLSNSAPAIRTIDSRVSAARDYILSCQRSDGAILWFDGGKLDPWDHTEAAMGLSICGEFEAAKQAFRWLSKHQNSDGSWFTKYYGEQEFEAIRADGGKDRNKIETNFVAYPATGLWHFYCASKDKAFLMEHYPTVVKAINYVLTLQTAEGDIQWASSTAETLPHDALLTACASIARSLECAIKIATLLGEPTLKWLQAYRKLAEALRNKPWRFDRTWESKERFSMDWFYPVLAGIYTQSEARIRLDERWSTFVNPNFGCRCVSDEPWITVAESCELCLALIASGQKGKAQELLHLLLRWQDVDGGFWTGYSTRDEVIWPEEKTSWTAAAFLLATDALENITPAASLFTSPSSLLTF